MNPTPATRTVADEPVALVTAVREMVRSGATLCSAIRFVAGRETRAARLAAVISEAAQARIQSDYDAVDPRRALDRLEGDEAEATQPERIAIMDKAIDVATTCPHCLGSGEVTRRTHGRHYTADLEHVETCGACDATGERRWTRAADWKPSAPYQVARFDRGTLRVEHGFRCAKWEVLFTEGGKIGPITADSVLAAKLAAEEAVRL